MPGDAGWHNAQLDFSKSMSYGDYLSLNSILDAQHPLSPDHNEMLFIIQHQTSELWMKLALFELRGALDAVRTDALPPAFKMLARVSRILEQLVQAWNVLSTMTPSEYSAMRPYLGQSSGFQSYQYRQLEFLLGNKNVQMLQPHAHRADILEQVRATLEAPSFYDEVVRLLAARLPDRGRAARARLDAADPARRDGRSRVARGVPSSAAALELYEMAEELVDLEDAFRQWRFRHVTTVERIIGFAGHRRHQRRAVPAQDARRRAVPSSRHAHHAVTHDAPRPGRRHDDVRASSSSRGCTAARDSRGMCRRTTSSATQTMPIAIASIVR